MITEITSTAQFRQVTTQDAVSVFEFQASWCGPCKAMNPYFTQLADTYGQLSFFKIDVDVHSQITQEVGARVLPTFVVYRGGTRVQTISGANPEALTTLVKTALRQV